MSKKENKRKRGNFIIEELSSIPTFYFAFLNHKKYKLAFYWNKSGRFELYTLDLHTKTINQITDGQLPKGLRAGYLWGRDDRCIYFTKDNDGDEKHNIHSIDIESKISTQLTNTPNVQDIPLDTSPDGQWLLFNANRNNGQLNMYRLQLQTVEIQQITKHKNPAGSGAYSKDGSLIAYVTNEEKNLVNQDIYIVKSDGTETKRVVQIKVGSRDNFVDWSDDGSFFTFTTDVKGVNQVATYNLKTEEITYYGEGKKSEISTKIIGNDRILAVSNINASVSPLLYNVRTGNRIELHFPQGRAYGSELINQDEVILTLNNPLSPSTIIRYNIDTEKSSVLLETDMRNIDSSKFVDAEHIFYPSTNNTMIPAIVYKPRNFDPNKMYPAIIIPHGGPTGQYFLDFAPNVQYFVDLDYVVMMPNVRGSTGYGSEFMDACIKDWGGKDHDDWIKGREWLVKHFSVNPEKVVVLGGSYGGYATLWCMSKSPDLWAAGVAMFPISDLHSLYEGSMEHFKFYFRQQMGDPIKNKELWIKRSPITHIHNIKSPLLLIHGKNDPRCPVSQSHIVVAKLKEHGFEEGVDFEYVEYDNEGHGSSGDISGKIRSLKLLDDFLYRKIEQH